MSVSSSKLTSKRGNITTNSSSSSSSSSFSKPRSNFEREHAAAGKSSTIKKDARRSRSVSAFSRSNSDAAVDVVAASEFVNRIDNPLFAACSGGYCGGDGGGGVGILPLTGGDVGREKGDVHWQGCIDSVGSSRGQLVARTGSGGDGALYGRSLSRVDTGRRARSVSVCPPSSRHLSESEAEQEFSSSSNCSKGNYGGSSIVKSVDVARTYSDMSDGPESPKTWCSQHPLPMETLNTSNSCVQMVDWETGGFPSSWRGEDIASTPVYHQTKEDCAEVEDDSATTGIYETVRLEVRRAMSDIQLDLESAIRGNNKIFTSNNGDDVPADYFYPGSTELILDIRSEYAMELEQSHERARKLREDLAAEEHRGLEINRIMKELVPEQKTPSLQRSRPRKRSIERRRMSRSLAEEAMTYFDECVSISTFDSSDFSVHEDPPVKLYGATTIAVDRASIPPGSSSASTTDSPRSCITNKELGIEGHQMHVPACSGLAVSTSSRHQDDYGSTKADGINTEHSRPSHFSFSGKSSENSGLQSDISKYVKKFEKGIDKDKIELEKAVKSKSHHCDLEEYNMQVPSQSFLLDKVTYKNRIESGSILLCGSSPFSVSSYPHVL